MDQVITEFKLLFVGFLAAYTQDGATAAFAAAEGLQQLAERLSDTGNTEWVDVYEWTHSTAREMCCTSGNLTSS